MIKGSIVALITPFKADLSLDIDRFKELVLFQIENGSSGIVIAGSTGEGHSLSIDEIAMLTNVAVACSQKKIKVFATTGFANTQETYEKTALVKSLGADGSLISFPYYVRPSFEGSLAHFNKISELQFPYIIYHHPKRTGVGFNAKELRKLGSLPYVLGIKDCSGDLNMISELALNVPVFCGDDPLALAFLSVGACGTISVIGNLLPKKWSEFVNALLQKDLKKGEVLYRQMEPIYRMLEKDLNPQAIKYAMSLRGFCEPIFRLPLVCPEEQIQREIQQQIYNL